MSVSRAAEAAGRHAAPGRPVDLAGPWWADPVAVAVYLALACWVTSGLWRHVGSLALVSGGSDVHFFEWALVHATRIFTHGENPLFSPELNAPAGVNMMANTGMLGMTVPLVPVTLIFGPAVAFTLLLTGGLAATAWAWYHVLSRHLVAHRPAAFVGGLFAGFAPGLVNQASGHPDLVAQFLIPFIVWRALSLRGVRDGVLLGLLVTWQAFLNEELLFQAGLGLAVFVAAYAAFRPGQVRTRIRPSVAGLGPALLTAGALLAYPLWFQFLGPQSYRALPESVLGYGTDLRAYTAFAQLSLVRHGASHSSYGAPPEENTFFGVPLLAAAALMVAGLWRRHVAVRALTAVALAFFLLSLGRTVTAAGHVVLARGPMSLLTRLPAFDTAVPTRFGLALIPVLALLLAFSIAAACAAPAPRWLRLGWPLVLAAVLLPIAPTPVLAKPGTPVPAFFTTGLWRRYVPAGWSVYPADVAVWAGSFTTMDWDNATSQGYRMVGGYFLGPHAGGRADFGPPLRATDELLRGIAVCHPDPQITAADRAAFRADMRYWHTAIVVLGPNVTRHDQLERALDQLTGQPPQPAGGILLWDVRALSAR